MHFLPAGVWSPECFIWDNQNIVNIIILVLISTCNEHRDSQDLHLAGHVKYSSGKHLWEDSSMFPPNFLFSFSTAWNTNWTFLWDLTLESDNSWPINSRSEPKLVNPDTSDLTSLLFIFFKHLNFFTSFRRILSWRRRKYLVSRHWIFLWQLSPGLGHLSPWSTHQCGESRGRWWHKVPGLRQWLSQLFHLTCSSVLLTSCPAPSWNVWHKLDWHHQGSRTCHCAVSPLVFCRWLYLTQPTPWAACGSSCSRCLRCPACPPCPGSQPPGQGRSLPRLQWCSSPAGYWCWTTNQRLVIIVSTNQKRVFCFSSVYLNTGAPAKKVWFRVWDLPSPVLPRMETTLQLVVTSHPSFSHQLPTLSTLICSSWSSRRNDLLSSPGNITL